MKFKNITQEELLKKTDHYKDTIEKLPKLNINTLEHMNSGKEVVLLDKDFSRMSQFFVEIIAPTINKIISILDKHNNKLDSESLKAKVKPQKKEKIVSDLEIMKLFLNIFPNDPVLTVLKNLKVLREEIISNKTINVRQLNMLDLKILGVKEDKMAFVIPSDKFSDIIFLNTKYVWCLQYSPLYFVTECLYSAILNGLTHLTFKSKDIFSWGLERGLPYFFTKCPVVDKLDLSQNADNYVIFIFTAAVILEQTYQDMNLKSYNYLPEGCLHFLLKKDYETLVKRQKELSVSTSTMEQLKINYMKRIELIKASSKDK